MLQLHLPICSEEMVFIYELQQNTRNSFTFLCLVHFMLASSLVTSLCSFWYIRSSNLPVSLLTNLLTSSTLIFCLV